MAVLIRLRFNVRTASLLSNSELPRSLSSEIYIIGGGIAGLSAARFLHDRGVSVVVFEARARSGGRISSRELEGGGVFEEGASWIHGPEKNPITGLALAAGAGLVPSDDDNKRLYDQYGALFPTKTVRNAEALLGALLDDLGGKKHQSFATALYRRHPEMKENPLWDYLLSAFVEFDIGGDVTELSGKDFYDDEDFSGEDLLITNGYHRLTDQLALGLDVRLNRPVTGIRCSDAGVEIETTTEVFTADRVIVAVPLGVLKAGTISFEPALPGYLNRAIDRLGFGLVNKYCCRWAEPFWDTDARYIGFTAETKGQFNLFLNHLTYSGLPVLTTYTYGQYAHTAADLPDDEVVALIMRNLRTIYGDHVPPPTEFYRTDWGGEEYTRGSYSFVPVGARSKLYDAFTGSFHNRLFFAGEHTNRDYRATVHGAYFSGVRAALEVLRVVGKSGGHQNENT